MNLFRVSFSPKRHECDDISLRELMIFITTIIVGFNRYINM